MDDKRTNRVVVLLNDQELEKLKAKVGMVPLSTAIRFALFPLMEPLGCTCSSCEAQRANEYSQSQRPRRFSDATKEAYGALGEMVVRTAVSDIEMKPPKVTVHLVHCEHGATFPNCKKWGCKFYEISNGRK